MALLAGCSDGYPSADQLDDRHMSPSAHLRMLNLALAAHGKERTLALEDDCHLVLSRPQAHGREKVLLPLLSTHVKVDTPRDTGHFRVQLMSIANGEPIARLRVAVKDWVDAVAWRSHFQQLQLRCAALGTPKPAH